MGQIYGKVVKKQEGESENLAKNNPHGLSPVKKAFFCFSLAFSLAFYIMRALYYFLSILWHRELLYF